jgi:exopolysaccharide biosynthesis polyprenyl glycosylphosphotransferase
MIKERLLIFSKVGLLFDILFTVAAFYLAYLLRAFVFPLPENVPLEFNSLAWLLFIIIPVWFILLPREGAYITPEKKPRDTYFPAVKAVFFGTLILLGVIFILKVITQSRLFIVLFSAIDVLFLLCLRKWLFPVLASRESKEVLIIGSKEDMNFVNEFLSSSPIRFHTRKFLEDTERFDRLVADWIDWVLIAAPPEKFFQYENIVLSCRKMGIPVSFAIKENYTFTRTRLETEAYNRLSLLTFSTAPELSPLLIMKYICDRIIALSLLFLSFPLFLIATLLIKIESEGPVIFKQQRCGLNGKIFNLYKFRTMVKEAEERKNDFFYLNEMNRIAFKMRDDPRVTRIGKLLRRLSLDELPQLINCVKGDMSIVGPRPPIPKEVENYAPQERRRLSMKPGLTCIWQVSGRNEIDFDRWMELDLEYIDNWTPLLDIKLILLSLPAILSGRGAY